MGVYRYDIDKPVEYRLVDSTLSLPVDKAMRDLIISKFSDYKRVEYSNAQVLRVESVEDNNDGKIAVGFSAVEFFDLLALNIIPMVDFKWYLKSKGVYDDVKDGLLKLARRNVSAKQVSSFESLVSMGLSSNVLAISVLIKDEDGNYLLTKRSSSLGIGAGVVGVSVTGTVDRKDIGFGNTVMHCAERVLDSTFDICEYILDIHLSSFVAGHNKLQPAAIINCTINKSLSELEYTVNKSGGCSNRIDDIYVVNAELLRDVIESEKLSEIAEYHLGSVIK